MHDLSIPARTRFKDAYRAHRLSQRILDDIMGVVERYVAAAPTAINPNAIHSAISQALQLNSPKMREAIEIATSPFIYDQLTLPREDRTIASFVEQEARRTHID